MDCLWAQMASRLEFHLRSLLTITQLISDDVAFCWFLRTTHAALIYIVMVVI